MLFSTLPPPSSLAKSLQHTSSSSVAAMADREDDPGPSRRRQASTTSHHLLSLRPHSSLSNLLLSHSSPPGLLTSSALNESDFSVPPIGVDLQEEAKDGFRRGVLEGLDAVKGLVLCIQTLDAASTYVGNWHLPDETWQAETRFPLRSSTYLVRLATHLCIPALHIFLGTGVVLLIASRKRLGWTSFRLLRRAFWRGLSLMLLNELLMVQYIVRSRGKAFFILLPLWSLGFNLFLASFVLLSLDALERLALYLYVRFSPSAPEASSYLSTSATSPDRGAEVEAGEGEGGYGTRDLHPAPSKSDVDSAPSERAPLLPSFLRSPFSKPSRSPSAHELSSSPSLNRLLTLSHLVSSLTLLVLIAGLLAVNLWTLPTGEDWSWATATTVGSGRSRRSWAYWFFVAPTPTTWERPYKGLVSQYAPLGWLPFTLLGAIYGRTLLLRSPLRPPISHRPRIASSSFALSLALFLLFVLTRLIPFGNLSSGHMTSDDGARGGSAPTTRGFYFSSWQTFFFTTNFPPDLAHFALWSSSTFFLISLSLLIPVSIWENSGVLQFGRAPMFFLAIQTLGFHYLIPGVLALLDWPRYLDLGWTLVVWLASLPVGWVVCEAWVVWKDRLGPDKLWRTF